ncbi:MerR family transcriptional regulator [Nocardioides deserti]|uniref:MerR family transcriptional regulator n=1 Tax=Nocardioides deserti TaxID=1588644 RepID=A0ABR6U3P4_9ACTN|nr:MerR family transcriptional regulator [Nocardioides deserti]
MARTRTDNLLFRNGRVCIETTQRRGDVAGDTRSAPALHIGEVASRTELSLRSLRHWEEVGLLHPSGRTDGGFRLYTEEDVEKILVIRRMKPLGFTLEEMRSVMTDIEVLRDPGAGPAEREQARGRLEVVRADGAGRRERLARQLAMADEFIELLTAESAPPAER